MIRELFRKSVHVGLALSLMACTPYLNVLWVSLIGVILGGVFLCARRWRWFESLRLVGRTSYGEVYFAAGVVLCAVFFLPLHQSAFEVGLLVLGIADPLAALIGKRYGMHRYRIWGDRLSLEGTVTCGVVASGIFLVYGVLPLYALLAGLVLALVEAISPRGSDNLLLPVIAGACMVLCA